MLERLSREQKWILINYLDPDEENPVLYYPGMQTAVWDEKGKLVMAFTMNQIRGLEQRGIFNEYRNGFMRLTDYGRMVLRELLEKEND